MPFVEACGAAAQSAAGTEDHPGTTETDVNQWLQPPWGRHLRLVFLEKPLPSCARCVNGYHTCLCGLSPPDWLLLLIPLLSLTLRQALLVLPTLPPSSCPSQPVHGGPRTAELWLRADSGRHCNLGGNAPERPPVPSLQSTLCGL